MAPLKGTETTFIDLDQTTRRIDVWSDDQSPKKGRRKERKKAKVNLNRTRNKMDKKEI